MLRYLKIFLLLLLTTQVSVGQKLVNSPYARFGPGSLEPTGSYKSLAMGRTGIAYRDPLIIAYQNPASYSSLDTNSFVFDFGVDYRIIGLDNGADTYQSDDMNFHHLVMGFPIGRKVGFATGVIPYSSGYYNINYTVDSDDPEYDPIIGETNEVHKGVGGYNKFFFGLGANPFGGFSVGANMTFLFGNVNRANSYRFVSDNSAFDNHSTESVQVNGYNFDFGAQYQLMLKNDLSATAGISYTTSSNYRGETELLTALYTGSSTSTLYSIDTLSYISTDDDVITLPGSLSLGLSLGKKNKFLVTTDYTVSQWSKAKFLGHESNFTNSSSIKMGAEYIPDYYANRNFLNRVVYRLGGHITNSHLVVNNEQLKEFGITFGVGLPLRRSNSMINTYFEYGNRGGGFDLGLHKETFYNFGLSFNFYDYWFIKRKYD